MDGNYEITDLNVTGAGKILKMKVNGKGVDVVTDITKNSDDEITAISINGVDQDIAGGGSSDIEENKEATIDVAAYTAPVEIEPTEGKDGMAKCTVALTNIPSGGSATLYAWSTSGANGDGWMYTNFDVAPDTEEEWFSKLLLDVLSSGITDKIHPTGLPYSYTKTDDNTFVLVNPNAGNYTLTCTRVSNADVTLW